MLKNRKEICGGVDRIAIAQDKSTHRTLFLGDERVVQKDGMRGG